MFNRPLFTQKTNSLPKQQHSSKPLPNTKQLTNNKINIRRCSSNQSVLASCRDKRQTNPIKIIPQKLHFESVQSQQLYEIAFYVRNQSSELQKVRIIPPVKKEFKIMFGQSFNNEIAAGLAVKVSVMFCSDESFDMSEDKIIVMGNSFKQQVILLAQTPKPTFEVPKVLSVGTLVLRQQKRIEVPIKNIGSKVGVIAIEDIRTNEYCPHISYPNKSITVLTGKTQFIQILVKPSTLGELQIKLSFSNMQTCLVRTIVLEDQVQIVDQNGLKILVKDFGQLFVGQTLTWPFFIANSTSNQVDCIFQTLNKKKQNADIKVDRKRNIFISQSSPQQLSASIESSCLSLQKLQMQVQPFTSEKNLMRVQKIPSQDEINIFIQSLTKNIQSSIYKAEHNFDLNRTLQVSNDPNEIDQIMTGQNNRTILSGNGNGKVNEKDKVINETLAVKFSNSDKIFKIPIKFFSKIPNLEINLNVLEFGKLFVKEREEQYFVVKNLSEQAIKLNFEESTTAFKENFKIQGPQLLAALSETNFKIKFRPLIKKKFAEILRIKVFDYFPIEIKIFGQCLGIDGSLVKNQMSLTMTERRNETVNSGWKSLLKDKTARQNTQAHNQLTMTINKNLIKTKMSQSSNFLLSQRLSHITRLVSKPDDEETAKVVFNLQQENMMLQKCPKENLFFLKEDFLTSTQKNKPNNRPSNLRELLRYRGLSLEELKRIEVHEKKLQFGHIFIGSTTNKKLTIRNKLQQPVLIELDTQGAQALAGNSREPVRVQGFGSYEAEIILHPTQLGELELPLNYIINKQHVFEVKVLAIVTLVNLELSARSFTFNLSEEEPAFEKEATLQVFNNGNKRARFVFDTPDNPSFRLGVLQGELEPKSHMNIKILYCPLNGQESGEQRVDVQKLKMRVQDGAENIIKCTGMVKEPRVSIKQTEFNSELSLVSVPITNKLTLRNFSKVQTYVRIEFEPQNVNTKAEDIASCLSVESSLINLGADDKKEIAFSFLCHEAKKIELNIVLTIRGMGVVRVPFSANVLYPDLLTLVPEINFRDVPIMSNYCIEMFSLINRTQTEIKLEIDPAYPKDDYFCQILAVKDKNLDINYEEEKYKTFLNSFMAGLRENRRTSKRRSMLCNKVLTLPPGEESIFNFKFVPKSVMKYDFQLPLRVFGTSERILRPVNIQIKCNAVDPVVYVEPRSIKFDMKVINEAKTSYTQSVFISNPHSCLARFRIEPLTRNSQPLSSNSKKHGYSANLALHEKIKREERRCSSMMLNMQSFTFSLTQGEIEPNGKIEIFVMFKAGYEGEFLQKFSIFLAPKSEDGKSPATAVSSYILDVSGSAIMPTLRFSCNEAILPVVPLNLESRLFVLIENHGYEAITICKWKTSNHFAHSEVKVNFIEGKLLSLAKKCLRVQIVFSSLVPISLTTMLEFYDEYGNKYELPMSCTADNSIFTCYPYLQSDNQHTILFYGEQKLIKLMPTGKSSYYETPKQLSGHHTMACTFIQKWINFQLNMDLKSFPATFIHSNGKEFVKLINRISSKNLIKKGEFTDAITETYSEQVLSENHQRGILGKSLLMFELYSETIKRLKQEGAFLNQLRPEFLLDYPQYTSYQTHKRKLVCSQTAFEVTSVESWISLFYQLCRVYLQTQITDKTLSKLKVQSDTIPAGTSSNLYSTAQIVLLKFLNHYLSSDEGVGSQMVVSFTEQMKVYEVLQRLLQQTFSLSLNEQLNALKNSVAIMSPHVFLSSITKFLFTHLKEFGLSAYLTPSDLFTIGVKELVLYLLNLFQMICHYSSPSLIRFEGAVGDKITKVIELENPTVRKVHYLVKIVYNVNDQQSFEKEALKSNNSQPANFSETQTKSLVMCKSSSSLSETSFMPESTQITIGPKQKSELKVVYHCKNAKGETASLYLIPTKEDEEFTIPQPLMFKLTTTILSKIMMKKITVSTSLYEVLPIHLDVELPSQIPESAEFNLTLYEETCQETAGNNLFNPQSFIFSQSHVRTLKDGNKDSFQLKLVPLSIGDKICKVSYFSSIYGEFIYEIQAKIVNPKILKEFKFKELKVNIEEDISIIVNKQNELMNSLLKVYYPDLYSYQCKTDKNLPSQGTKRVIPTSSSKLNLSVIEKATPKDLKYEVQILDNPYITIMKGYNTIEKLEKENKIMLKTNFTKPCKEFSVTLCVKNDFLKDRRLYKVIFVVISPPKIVKMQFKTAARQEITQKLPIKISPCEVTVKSSCESFTIENLARQYMNNTDLVCLFKPQWMVQKQVSIEIQNKESLEQIIYQISLKAEEPQNFGTFELVCSSLFDQEVSIPIEVQDVFGQIIEGEPQSSFNGWGNSFGSNLLMSKSMSSMFFEVKRMFKRPHSIQSDKFYPFSQTKNMKSYTGVKQFGDTQYFGKETSDKFKTLKTRSFIEDRCLKSINMTVHPSEVQSQTGSIRLSKPNSEEYYWAKVVIRNRAVKRLKPIKLQQKLNHSKVEVLEDLVLEQGIDFGSEDFEFKFSQEERYLKFIMRDAEVPVSHSTSLSPSQTHMKPCLIFSPVKQIQTERMLYFKSNNRQFMLPIQLKSDQMPTIVVPEITTANTEPKLTYINLINGTDEAGVYRVVVVNHDDPTSQSWKFVEQEDRSEIYSIYQCPNNNTTDARVYSLKPKEKKQIKISFQPKYIHQKEKFILKFESLTLPNYTYILNGKSEFKPQQQHAQFEIYQDHIRPFHVNFSNLFQKKQYFNIQLQTFEGQLPKQQIQDLIKIQQPLSKKFTLDQGDYKGILLSIKDVYFKPQQPTTNNSNQKQNEPNFQFVILIKTGQRVVKKYFITLLVIKNLFSNKKYHQIERPMQKLKTRYVFEAQKQPIKQAPLKNKNFYHWSCKARQNIYETIQIPSELNFFAKQIKCPNEILKYITFTCISQSQESAQNLETEQINLLKIKYSPMKPIKKKKYDLILIGTNQQKYRIECQISVQQPVIDDTITIKTTQIDQIGCVSFKLTNTVKSAARYRAYFVKKLPEFEVQAENGVLQGYGKPGTSIMVKFKSHINNRRLQDRLIIETEDMYWCFKVKGMISKDGH